MQVFKHLWLSLVFLGLVVSHTLKAQQANVDDIIQKYYKAIGGYQQLKSIKTLVQKGTYVEPAYKLILPAITRQRRTGERVIGSLKLGYAEGLSADGVAWEYSVKKGVTYATGEAKKAIKRGAEFDPSFVDYKTKGHQVTYEGLTTLFTKQAHILKVILKDGWVKYYYLDAQSGVVIGLKKAAPIHAKGKDVETITHISGYKSVKGVLMPFNFVERRTADGKLFNALLLDTIEANLPLDNAIFAAPKVARNK